MKETLAQISELKKSIMTSKLKASFENDSSLLKDVKKKKKEIARLFTKLNTKKTLGKNES